MYDAINDSRVRPSHLAHDGTIRAVGDAFWKTHSPPLGYRCRCNLISLTEEQATARSRPNPDGEGTGLYKTPQLEGGIPAEPDKGWDYNPFEDRLGPLRKSLERFDPKLRAVGEAIFEKASILNPVPIQPFAPIDEYATTRAKSILSALTSRALDAAPHSGAAMLEALWVNADRYQAHVAKRLGNQDIVDTNDYAIKTFQVLAEASRMMVAITANDYASGKLQATANGWIVLIGDDGHIITSHPFDPQKKTFEVRHTQVGDRVHDYIIDADIRKILESLFTGP